MTRIDGRGKRARDDGLPDVLGHRGASGRAPENTPAAFALAIRQGAHGVELDTHLSADGVPVVRHDLPLPPRDGAPRSTRDLTAAELAALGVADLRTCLDAVHAAGRETGTAPWVLVEIKSAPDGHAPCAPPEEAVAAVGAVLRDHPVGERCVLESFDRAVVEAAARLLPELPRAVLADGATTRPGSPWLGGAVAPGAAWTDPDPVRAATDLGAVAIAVDHAWLDEGLADRARRAGLEIWAWTVDDAAEATRAIRLGARALVTDHPGRILAALATGRES